MQSSGPFFGDTGYAQRAFRQRCQDHKTIKARFSNKACSQNAYCFLVGNMSSKYFVYVYSHIPYEPLHQNMKAARDANCLRGALTTTAFYVFSST